MRYFAKCVLSMFVTVMVFGGLVNAQSLSYGPFDLTTAYGRYSEAVEIFRIESEQLPIDDPVAYREHFESYYPSHLKATDEAIAEIAQSDAPADTKMLPYIKATREALVAYHEAIIGGDEAAIAEAGEHLYNANLAEVEVNNSFRQIPTGDNAESIVLRQNVDALEADRVALWLYGGLTVFFAVLLVGAMYWAWHSRPRLTGSVHDKEAAELAMSHRKGLVVATLWGLIGSGITLVLYIASRGSGGAYLILYGPVIFGLISFFQGVVRYRRSIKHGGFVEQARAIRQLTDSGGNVSVKGYLMVRQQTRSVYEGGKAIPAAISIKSPGSVVIKPVSGEEISIHADDVKRVEDMLDKLFITTRHKQQYIFGLREDVVRMGFWRSYRRQLSPKGFLNENERAAHNAMVTAVAKALGKTVNALHW